LAPTVYADTVDLKLIGVGNGRSIGNVYLSPYTATVNNNPTPISVVCLDFEAETYVNQKWPAETHTLDNLAGTRWGAGAADKYKAAAWLTLQLLNPNISYADQVTYSFAVWRLFIPGATTSGMAPYDAGVTLAMNTALANAASIDPSSFVIYTPTGNGTPCNGGPCTSKPQEFLAIRTPETAAMPILAFNVLALIGVIAFFRRRLVTTE
jgi:hypothetical protein